MVKKTPKKANKLLWVGIPLMIIGLVVVIIGLIQGTSTNSTWMIGIVIMSSGWILFKISPKKN